MPRVEEIVRAVNDPEWQKFRLSMKGQSTGTKLAMLKNYYLENIHLPKKHPGETAGCLCETCSAVKLRVDNYIKALCRGGQLYSGESLLTMFETDWKPRLKQR